MGMKFKDAHFLSLFLAGVLLTSCGGASSEGTTTTPASPVVTHMIYLASTTGLTTYSASDGKPLWSFQPSSTPFFSPQEPLALANGVVYWITDKLYALDAMNGKEQWSAPIGNAPGAVYVSGNLVFVLSDTQLYAFASSDGTLRWRQNLQPTLGNTAKLLVRNGVLYSINGANLTALRPDSGGIQWQFSLDPGLGESITDIFVAGSSLLVWSPSTLDGLDASTGQTLWHKDTQAKDLRVVGDTIYTIFIDVPGGGLGNIVTGLRTLHLQDGTQLWQVNTPVQDGQASAITDDTFFRAVGLTGGDVEARSIQDGHLLWQVPSGNTVTSLVADGGTLYLETQQGEVDARQVADGKLLWQRQEAGGEMSLSIEDHLLYLVGKDSGVVLALDPATGTSRWHVALGNSLSGFMAAS